MVAVPVIANVDAVTEPVAVNVDTVAEPALSTLKLPALTVKEPMFNVVSVMLSVFAMSLPVIESSTIVALVTEFAPGADVTFVNPEPSPENPVAVTVPITCSVVAGVVVPMPTLPDVVAMVAVPVIDKVDAVTEPVAVNVDAVAEPALSTLKLPALTVKEPIFNVVSVMLSVFAMSLPVIESSTIVALVTEFALGVDDTFVNPEPSPENPVAVTVPITCSVVAGVVVPMPTLPDVVAMVAVPVIDKVDAVTEPVAVNVDTVAEPALSTLKLPALTVKEPMFNVVSVMLSVFAMSLPVIESSTIVALVTEFAPGADVTFVNPEPSPENPVAVTVPITCSVVAGVVVPMPTLPDVVAMVAVPVIDKVDAVTEPVAVNVDTVAEPALSTLKLPVLTVKEPMFNVVSVMLSVFAMSLPVIESSTIVALVTEFAPGADVTFVNPEPSPENPVAVTVPITCSVVAGVVVPMPTLPDVVAMVAVPVIAKVDAVTEPVDVIVVAVIEPALSTLKLPALTVKEPIFNVVSVMLSVFAMSLPVIESSTIVALVTEFALGVDDTFVNPEPSPENPVAVTVPITCSVVAGVVVPMPTLPDVVAMVAVPVIDKVDAVTEPVAVNVDTVAEPALSTLKLPALTVNEPMFNVVSVMLSVFAMSLPVIESSTIVALLTEFALGVDDTFVNPEPSPINPVAVTVPITCSVVAGVVVPMPTLPDVVAMVAVPVIAKVDAVTEPVDVIVEAVIEPALSTLKLPALTVKEPIFNVVSVMLSVFAMSLPVIESSTIVALVTEFAPGVDDTFVSCDPSPTNPVAVTVPITCSVVAGVVVPMPTLPDVVAMVAVPVIAMADAVTEPALSTLKTLPVIAKVEAVTEPVEVMVVAVIEPAVSTLKPPSLPAVIEPVVVNVDTVVEPAFIVPVVLTLTVPDNLLVVIAPSTIWALLTELSAIADGTFVNCDPSPINPVAVTVPITRNAVAGVVVPMPILPSFLTYKVDVPEVFTTCSDASVFAEDEPAM